MKTGLYTGSARLCRPCVSSNETYHDGHNLDFEGKGLNAGLWTAMGDLLQTTRALLIYPWLFDTHNVFGRKCPASKTNLENIWNSQGGSLINYQ